MIQRKQRTLPFCLIWILLFCVPKLEAKKKLRGRTSSGNLKLEDRGIVVETDVHEKNDATASVFPVATATFPMHAKQGTHHVHIYIGSPPQRQTLIVDTGSRLVAFPCEPCESCGSHVTPSYFDPQLSSTTIENSCDRCKFETSNCFAGRCEFNQQYMEGSGIKAFEVEDIVWIGSDDMVDGIEQHMQFFVPFSFGCLLSETGMFKTQYADGIMGVAKSDFSFINELYNSGAIMYHGFSICMTRYNGYFSIGGTPFSYPNRNHLEQMAYIPTIRDDTKYNAFYRIKVAEVKLGGVKITKIDSLKGFNSQKGTIVDSGTSDTYLPLSVTQNFQVTWSWLTGFKHSNSQKSFTYKEFSKLPNLTIILNNGYEWIIEPRAYMEESRGIRNPKWQIDNLEPWEGTLVFFNRIYLSERFGCVLGANAMAGHDILFEQNRIGIARANCKM